MRARRTTAKPRIGAALSAKVGLLLGVLLLLVGAVARTDAPASRERSTPAAALTSGRLSAERDVCMRESAPQALTAPARVVSRAPAVAANAPSTSTSTFVLAAPTLGGASPTARNRAQSVGWRRRIPRMDSGEPPGSAAFAS